MKKSLLVILNAAKKLNTYTVIICTFLLTFTSCDVHEWPEIPELVTCNLRLTYNTEMTEWLHLYDDKDIAEQGFGKTYDNRREQGVIRYIVRTYPLTEKQRTLQSCAQEFVFTKDLAEGYDHQVALELMPGDYTLMVWSDLAESPEEVKQNWEALKLRKKKRKSGALGGVPQSLPAMVKAFRIGEKAAATGFDWEQKEDVWAKVKEELMEVDAEIEAKNKEHLTDEIGDLFFALINACRLYGIDPEGALERTNKKFIRRFGYVEQRAEELGKTLHEMSLEEMDKYWDECKQQENK